MTNSHPNLSNKTGSLAFALKNNSATINGMVADPKISTAEVKDYISKVIMTITTKEVKSPATQRFLTSLKKNTNKTAIALLVYNTILSGDNLAVC